MTDMTEFLLISLLLVLVGWVTPGRAVEACFGVAVLIIIERMFQ